MEPETNYIQGSQKSLGKGDIQLEYWNRSQGLLEGRKGRATLARTWGSRWRHATRAFCLEGTIRNWPWLELLAERKVTCARSLVVFVCWLHLICWEGQTESSLPSVLNGGLSWHSRILYTRFWEATTNLVETAHWEVYLTCLLQVKSSKIFNRPVSGLVAGRILEAVS